MLILFPRRLIVRAAGVAARLALVSSLVLAGGGCVNRGQMAPDGTGGGAGAGAGGQAQGSGGSGGPADGSAGMPDGAGGMASGAGGAPGTGGTPSGAGGTTSGNGGAPGTGGASVGAGGASVGAGGAVMGAGGAVMDAGVDSPAADSGAGGSDAAINRCLPGVSPASALLTDFSPLTWNPTLMRWGSAGNLAGSIMTYSGTMRIDGGATTLISPPSVDTTAANPLLRVRGDVASADFGGVVLVFDQCLNTTAYSGVRFTLGGTTAGCDLFFQLDTYSQQTVANGGTCVGVNCFRFPNARVQVGTAPITITFESLAATGLPATADGMRAEIVGLQLQLQSPTPAAGGPQPSCLGINLTVDDVQLVAN